jgi:MFS family permease
MRIALGGIVLSMFALALAHELWQAIAAMIGLTLGTSTIFGLANIIVQERAPDAIRGRVSAIVGLSFFGVLPFAGLLISWLADALGLRVAMGGAAACYGLGGMLLLARHGRLCRRAIEADASVSAQPG